MADDLDDLLDEVESKFCNETSSKNPTKTNSRQRGQTLKQAQSSRPSRANKDGDDLNDIIRDICDDGLDIPNPPAPSASTKPKNRQTTGHKPKCLKLLLGGSKYVKGLCTVSEQKTCDQLRCTSCDFKVVMFDNFQWQEDCDYLFFRNNVPDFQKLKAKLMTKQGCRAYACQCTWRSVFVITDVLSDSKLKWVCGKHRQGVL